MYKSSLLQQCTNGHCLPNHPHKFATLEIRSRGSPNGSRRLLSRRSRLPLHSTPSSNSQAQAWENVLNSRSIMKGYHIVIRVTAQSNFTATKTHTTTAKTGTPARAAWTTNTFIPKSIFERLPSHTPRKTSRNNAILGSKRRDYRYGPIRIDWLDLKGSSQPYPSIEKSKNGANGSTMNNTPTTSATGNGKERDLRGRGWLGNSRQFR